MRYLYRMLLNRVYQDDKEFLEEFCLTNKLQIGRSVKGLNISSEIELNFRGKYFYLHEFPGNCSSLIISHIQDHLYGDESIPLGFIEIIKDFCIKCGYGCIFISLTDNFIIEKMINYGFKKVWRIWNPHSESLNTFLALEVNNESKTA